MNEVITTQPQFDLSNPEQVEMLKAALTFISNGVVSASDVARKVQELSAAVEELRAAVALANSQREQAEAAYRQVNSQRIDAENMLNSMRSEHAELTRLYDRVSLELAAAEREKDEQFEKIERLTTEVQKWEKEVAVLVADTDTTIAAANAKRTAAEQEVAATRVELAAVKAQLIAASEEAQNLHQHNQTLRVIIRDAQLVLSGNAAAE